MVAQHHWIHWTVHFLMINYALHEFHFSAKKINIIRECEKLLHVNKFNSLNGILWKIKLSKLTQEKSDNSISIQVKNLPTNKRANPDGFHGRNIQGINNSSFLLTCPKDGT